MKFIRLACLFFFLVSCSNSFAQKKFKHYVITKSGYMQGEVKMLNDREIELVGSNTVKTLSADEVLEFSVFTRDVYGSISVDGKRKFVIKLASGTTALYALGDRYFLKNGNEEIEFGKSNYMEVLRASLRCDQLPLVVFNKLSLKNLVDQYNKTGCSIPFVPFFKIGLMGGTQFYTLRATIKEQSNSDFVSKGSTMSLGAFIDVPFFRPKELFISTELQWVSFQAKSENSNDVKTDFTNLMLPVGLKYYVINSGGLHAFVKPGVIISYFKSDTEVFAAYLKPLAFGFQIGTGVEVPLTGRMVLHAEAKYIRQNQSGNDLAQVGYSSFALLAGISF